MLGSPKIFAAAALLLAIPLAAAAEVVYDGPILGRPKKYDYAPAHLFLSGVHHLWWCTASNSGDEIWMATKPGKLGAGGWTPAGKVFGRKHSPLTFQHTCDPSVLKGDFSFGGEPYGYAMYYTSARQSGGVNNAIGVAFSSDLTEWTANPEPVITPAAPTPGYGAGMSGVAYKPGTKTIEQVYFDSSATPTVRLAEGTDGSVFAPIPGEATQIAASGALGNGESPDIAFHPGDQRWYAVISNTTEANASATIETRVLRATAPNTLTGGWEVVGTIGPALTGEAWNHNPGLGKNADSTLYVDAEGWAYCFFGAGAARPEVATWEVAQARFKPGPPAPPAPAKKSAPAPGNSQKPAGRPGR